MTNDELVEQFMEATEDMSVEHKRLVTVLLKALSETIVGLRKAPTSRESFRAGMRRGVELCQDYLSHNQSEAARHDLDHEIPYIGEVGVEIVVGERFSLDDLSASEGYWRAHPEDKCRG